MPYGLRSMDVLKNKKITEIAINDNKDYLRIRTEDGETHYFHAFGDCCSVSWVEHINGIYALPATVRDIEERFMDGWEGGPYGEYIQQYQTVLLLTNGRIDIEYRNSSNGYYGGSLEYTGTNPVSTVTRSGERVTVEFTPLVEDF